MDLKCKVNEQIQASKVFLVEDGGEGEEITLEEAVSRARFLSLDVVQISNGKDGVPVCKIVDFGKMKYNFNKTHKQSHGSVLKEMKFNYNIGEHDMLIKHRKIQHFIEKKHKVQYIMELRGRERNMVSIAMEKIQEFLKKYFSDIATWQALSVSENKGKIVLSTILIPK